MATCSDLQKALAHLCVDEGADDIQGFCEVLKHMVIANMARRDVLSIEGKLSSPKSMHDSALNTQLGKLTKAIQRVPSPEAAETAKVVDWMVHTLKESAVLGADLDAAMEANTLLVNVSGWVETERSLVQKRTGIIKDTLTKEVDTCFKQAVEAESLLKKDGAPAAANEKAFLAYVAKEKLSDQSNKLDFSIKKAKQSFRELCQAKVQEAFAKSMEQKHARIRATVCTFCILALVVNGLINEGGTKGKDLGGELQDTFEIVNRAEL